MRTSSLHAGFTLTEVIVSIGIFGIIIAAVGVFEANIFRYQRNANGSFTTVQDSETIMKTISKELRSASQGSDGSYAIQTAATNTLMFFADTDGDGKKERIRYSFIGSALYRAKLVPVGSPLAYTGAESTSTLIVNVRNIPSTPVFSYYSSAFAGTTTGSLSQPVTTTSVRLVQVSVTLDVNPSESPVPRTYSADVTLRNLKDNL